MRTKMNLLFVLSVVICVSCFFACEDDDQENGAVMRQVIHAGGTAVTGAPYSPGILAGNTLYCAGRLGTNPDTGELGNGIQEQTRFALESIQSILAGADMDMSSVVSVNVFLKNLDDFADMNETYRTFFPNDPPARTTVSAQIVNDALIEIACIAVKTQ